MKEIRTCTIRFANPMSDREIPLFRGAVINSIPEDNVLFHNHLNEKYRYSYPLIQYKLLENRAAIVCVEEGCDAVSRFLNNFSSEIRLGRETVRLVLDSSAESAIQAGIDTDMHDYRLQRWLPLNEKNYGQWLSTGSLTGRTELLERILTGNILSFGKGTGVQFQDEIKCILTDIHKQYYATYKEVRLMAFDISFKANVILPKEIGLGKGAGTGHGILL